MSDEDKTQVAGISRKVATIFLTGNVSATLVIPIDLARKHSLTKGTNVVVEEHEGGLLIRRLEV